MVKPTSDPKKQTQHAPPIAMSNTGGGANIEGDVHTGSGFIARDKNVHGDEIGGDKVEGDKIIYLPPSDSGYQRPVQRPPQVLYFRDRKTELAQLMKELQPGKVVAICGPGGMGKSALAAKVVWTLAPEEEAADRFPDGICWYSFHKDPHVVGAYRHIARSFGEDPSGSAGSARNAAQRALSQRTALLLLDGTDDADDLSSLLDIRNRCSVLITSRKRADALEHRQDLPPLPSNDAVSLLREWAGPNTGNLETEKHLAELVGHLPLAVCLAGHYLKASGISTTDYCNWLKESPLSALDQGDRRDRSIPLLLEHSLNQVSKPAQSALAVLGSLALAPFPAEAVTAALGIENQLQTKCLLGELVAYGLLIKQEEEYKLCHSLIHAYAGEKLEPPARTLALLVSWMLKAVEHNKSNLGTLARLQPHIMTLQRRCLDVNMWSEACFLAESILSYLELQGLWVERVKVAENALAACRKAGTKSDEGAWLGNLGNAYADLGYMDEAIMVEAINCYRQALSIFQEMKERHRQGPHLSNLGLLYARSGKVKEAIELYHQALAISQEIGDKKSQAHQLGNLGVAYTSLERTQEAIQHHQHARSLYQEIDDKRGEAHQLGNLGAAYAAQGKVSVAIDLYQQALQLVHKIGDKRAEGLIYCHLGQAYVAQGNVSEAIKLGQQSVLILKDIQSPDVDNVIVWLNDLQAE